MFTKLKVGELVYTVDRQTGERAIGLVRRNNQKNTIWVRTYFYDKTNSNGKNRLLTISYNVKTGMNYYWKLKHIEETDVENMLAMCSKRYRKFIELANGRVEKS